MPTPFSFNLPIISKRIFTSPSDREDLRARLETSAREICGPKNYLISASLGASSCLIEGPVSLDQILAESDRSLYSDKRVRKTKKENAQT